MRAIAKRIGLWGLLSVLFFVLILPSSALADAIVGETVVTLGNDLTPEQKSAILKEMGVDNDVKQLVITNQEEHKYLGKYMKPAVIGSKAISSAKITLKEKGYGIRVKTNNINTITQTMYANAMITAGVTDADVYVTAPFKVSGTAGLTGIIKAFEEAADIEIDENQKQVANEEMVRTSEIAEKIGDTEKATLFVIKVKEEVAKKKPETKEEVRNIVINVSNQYNINLDQKEVEDMTQFGENFSELDVDWDLLNKQLQSLGDQLDKVEETLNTEETRNIFQKMWDGIVSFFNWLGSLFS